LIFLDEINRRNPTPLAGRIEATNPCGELPLLPYESCNLASINLAKMVSGQKVDWERLKERIVWGIRFLDDVIEVNRFATSTDKRDHLRQSENRAGSHGFADMLIKLEFPYHSRRAVDFAQRMHAFCP